jgi:hypothetical protein
MFVNVSTSLQMSLEADLEEFFKSGKLSMSIYIVDIPLLPSLLSKIPRRSTFN